MSEVPMASENIQDEIDLQVWLCRPGVPAGESYEYRIKDAFNIQVSYGDGSEHNTLRFSTFKDTGFVQQMTADGWDWEVVVRWWDPRRGQLVEPPNSRFVILNSKENLVDQTNRIDYVLPGKTWLLEKVKVRVGEMFNTAWGLNRDYDRAKEAYEDAERDYNSILRQFENTGRQIQQETWPGRSHGPLFATWGIAWLIRDRRARFRSLAYHASYDRVSWYSADRGGWVRLNMNPSDTAERNRRERFRELGADLYLARQVLLRARSAYAAAERAARESSRNGTRFFYNRTPARVISTLWREGQERDAGYVNHGNRTPGWQNSPYPLHARLLKNIWRDFTATRDARGRAWTATTPRQNWEVRLNQSLWSVIQDFRERGLIDWRMSGPTPGGGGRSLQLVPYGSLEVDQTRRVTLRLDGSVLDGVEEIDGSEHQTVTFVLESRGLNHYTYWNRENSANQTPWGLWEGGVHESNAEGFSEALDLTAKQRGELSRRYAVTSSRKVQVQTRGPIPMLDYEPHHIIGVSDHQSAASSRRVTRIVVEKPDAKSPITAVVQLGTRRTNRMVSYARTLSKVVGETDVIQGHIPIDPVLVPSQIPRDALYAPAISSMGVAVRINEDGRARAVVRAALATHDVPVPDDAERFDETPEGEELIDDEEYEGE